MSVGYGASNLFNLPAGFHPQSSEESSSRDIVDVLGATGDIQCQTGFNAETTATAEYEVCGSVTLSISLGAVVNGYIVRSVELSHEAGQAPTVRIEGIKYVSGTTITQRTHAISQAVNAAAVVGLVNASNATSVTYRWEVEISTAMGPNGQVAYAVSRTPKLTYEESGTGHLSAEPSVTNYITVSYANSDSNQELDTYTATLEQPLTST